MGTSALAPSPEASQLGEILLNNEDVQRTILQETLDSAAAGELLESGRTVCGDPTNVRLPFHRRERSVELSACPTPNAGIWHTHVTQQQLRDPEHSLPDWANVIFDAADASMVVGIQTSEVIVAATDREAMLERFEDALGIEVHAPTGVVEALRDGAIDSPTRARQRVRNELHQCVHRVDSAFPEFEQLVSEHVPSSDPVDLLDAESPERSRQYGERTHPHSLGDTTDGAADLGRMRQQSREIAEIGRVVNRYAPVDLVEQSFATAVGTMVGYGINHYVLERS